MNPWQAALLGIIQGLTEFLPVSSSGHLVIVQSLFHLTTGTLTFDVMVHLGTLLAVVVALRKDIVLLLTGLRPGRDTQIRRGRRLLLLIAIATVPAGLVGLLFQEAVESAFTSLYIPAFMLIVTGTVLYVAERARGGKRALDELNAGDAFFVGCAQALAVLPGLSRSGSTISAALVRGIAREDAARFSFLLSIPTILGAGLLNLPDLVRPTAALSGGALLIGLITSAVTGYLAISLLLRLVQRGRLVVFSYYTWAVGALVLAMAFLGR